MLDNQDQSLFCPTCLKNQHLFNETLAGYFPPPDAPDYAEYEKQLPTYRKQLEARYPQVCEACEPGVRERIRATGYAAKTDHLRRVLERNRGGGGSLAYARSNWKSIGIFLGGAGWAISLGGQLVWDGLAIWSLEKTERGLGEVDEIFTTSKCLNEFARGLEVPPGCTTLTNPVAYYGLILGLCSLWWNPKLRERLNHNGGRIVGLADYYKLQGIVLVGRWIAWWFLSNMSIAGEEVVSIKGAHICVAFLVLVVSGI